MNTQLKKKKTKPRCPTRTCQEEEDDGVLSRLHQRAFSILPRRDRPSPVGTKHPDSHKFAIKLPKMQLLLGQIWGLWQGECELQKLILTFVFSSALLSSSRRRSRSSISCWRARCLRSCSSSLRSFSWYSLSSSSRCSCSRRSRSSRSGRNRGQQIFLRPFGTGHKQQQQFCSQLCL